MFTNTEIKENKTTFNNEEYMIKCKNESEYEKKIIIINMNQFWEKFVLKEEAKNKCISLGYISAQDYLVYDKK